MKSSPKIRCRQLDFLHMQIAMIGHYMVTRIDAFDTDILDYLLPDFLYLKEKIEKFAEEDKKQ